MIDGEVAGCLRRRGCIGRRVERKVVQDEQDFIPPYLDRYVSV
ncbi:MAG: hypothetical protein V5A88_06330 [Candidatus Thermoplasmatota archaeon]